MTGEITLRGRVLAIGGLKEKAMAAHRVGIRRLLVPTENQKDLADIPPKIRSEIQFTLVDTMDAVIEAALMEPVGDEVLQDDLGLEHTTGAASASRKYAPEEPPLLTEVESESDVPTPLGGLSAEGEPPPGV